MTCGAVRQGWRNLEEILNDLYETGVVDDSLNLLYEANKEIYMKVKTPLGDAEEDVVENIVLQGDTWSPIMASVQVDKFGKECVEEEKYLYNFKNKVAIPPLSLIDDLITVSECGHQTDKINAFINVKSAEKTLQFGPDKCKRMHVGKEQNKIICRENQVSEWKVEHRKDNVSGEMKLVENMNGDVEVDETYAEKYLGTWIESRGGNMKTIEERKK